MYKRILVPIDGSASSMRGLDEAVRLARTAGAKLRILHVIDGIAFAGEHSPFTATAESFRESGRKLIQEVLHRLRKQPVQVGALTVENLSGRAADSIVKEADKWRADLIVMGTHGRRGFNRLILGSDADLVVRTASVPVLLVRPSKTKGRGRKRK